MSASIMIYEIGGSVALVVTVGILIVSLLWVHYPVWMLRRLFLWPFRSINDDRCLLSKGRAVSKRRGPISFF